MLNVLPVLAQSGLLPEPLKQKVQMITERQDHIYQFAVQVEALLPLVIVSLFIPRRSPRILTTALIYTLVFLRVRYMTNYATHGLFTTINSSFRTSLGRIPILLKVYDFVIGLVSRGLPDGVVTQPMLKEALQNHAAPQDQHQHSG